MELSFYGRQSAVAAPGKYSGGLREWSIMMAVEARCDQLARLAVCAASWSS